LYIADDVTGYGLWQQDGDDSWYIDIAPVIGYDLYHDPDALKITGIYGFDEADWRRAVDDFLADYGLKLGRFDVVKGDRYDLVELGGEC
jgi:hypothetical protein